MSVVAHLKDRHLDMSLHRVWVSEQNSCATFPLWNLSGQITGYQRYRPYANKEKRNDPREGRYFTRVKEGKIGVWGLESWSLTNTLFITEGIFDAARLTSRGASATALLSYDVAPTTKNWLYTLRQFRKIVAVCDNDSSGLKLSSLASVFTVTSSNDLGDASDNYVTSLLTEYI